MHGNSNIKSLCKNSINYIIVFHTINNSVKAKSRDSWICYCIMGGEMSWWMTACSMSTTSEHNGGGKSCAIYTLKA